jgi:O-antigen/teichoic acid export membrane protein
MQTRLLWRRSATALGLYGSVALGFLASIVAARRLGPDQYGLFTLAIFAAGFLQVLLDLTVEEAMIKYGFRYTTSARWGRLRWLYRRALVLKTLGALLAAVALTIVAPFADSLFNADGLRTPFLLAALLPLSYIPEAPAGAALVLTGRYDVRAGYTLVTQLLRAIGLVVGSRYGVDEAVLGLVVGQVAGSLAVGRAAVTVFHRFPAAPPEPLGEDRSEIVRFVIRSSVGSGIVSLRTAIVPLLLGAVSVPRQVGYFRAGQAPLTGLTALTAPARLILITEQTRDWESGAPQRVFTGLRRYSLTAFVAMVVSVPFLYWWMPTLIRIVFTDKYEPATDAARLMLLAGAVGLVFAWTKSLPVSVGRPELRIATHGIETLVLIPLVLVFGSIWDATGAAAAVLIATTVFALTWAIAVVRLHREHTAGQAAAAP